MVSEQETGAQARGGRTTETALKREVGEPENWKDGLIEANVRDGGDEEADCRKAIEAAIVDHLFRQFSSAAVINILLAALVVASLFESVSIHVLLVWAAAIVTITGARLALQRAYRRTHEPRPAVWQGRYRILSTLSAFVWGSAALLFVSRVPAAQEITLIVAIAGIAAGALPINAAVMSVYIPYLAASLTPVVIIYITQGTPSEAILAAMAVLYGGALAVAAGTFSRSLRQNYELSVRLNKANRELRVQASHDRLTMLWNRSRFELALDRELARAERYRSHCSLIMIDIDNFKKINDQYGHDAGDRVLTRFSELLRNVLRDADQPARWGGEEFMVLLPETDCEGAAVTGERIRQAVQDGEFGMPEPITVSLSVTEYIPGELRAVLMKRLDDELYRAKENGRNRVEVAPPPALLRS